MRERTVEARLRRKVVELGGACEKFIPDDKPGMPDRIVMMPGGVLVWVETKRPEGGRLSELQKHRHRWLAGLGQRVVVAWTPEQVDALVDELARDPAYQRAREQEGPDTHRGPQEGV